MEPDGAGDAERTPSPEPQAEPGSEPEAQLVAGPGPVSGPEPWRPGIPSIREFLPSLLFGAALPIGVYFIVRRHVTSDTQALIVAGCFSVAYILIAFIRQRTVDVVGLAVLVGFAAGVITSTLLGGNDYVLKVRDGFFTLLFGVACIVTLYTHDRPAFFYVNRYLSAGTDPAKVSAFDELHDLPLGRHIFRTLSLVWGIGLVVEASARLTLADLLPTGTFIAVSPFITGSVIGSLFAFTVVYTKRTQIWSLSSGPDPGHRSGGEGGATPPRPPHP
ncbi:MAG TPA: VC0807 family protein [Acidimicrobiales bacterium]